MGEGEGVRVLGSKGRYTYQVTRGCGLYFSLATVRGFLLYHTFYLHLFVHLFCFAEESVGYRSCGVDGMKWKFVHFPLVSHTSFCSYNSNNFCCEHASRIFCVKDHDQDESEYFAMWFVVFRCTFSKIPCLKKLSLLQLLLLRWTSG